MIREIQVKLVLRVPLVLKVLKVRLDLKVIRVTLESKALKVTQVKKVRKVTLVRLEQLAHRVHKDLRVKRAPLLLMKISLLHS